MATVTTSRGPIMRQFSDFANEPTTLKGHKLKLDDIVNKTIIVRDANIKSSQYGKNKSGKYATLQFSEPGSDQLFIVFTGSDVLITQLEKYAHEMPFKAVIKKINRYYTLS